MTKQDLVKLLKREFTNEDGNIDISELDFGKFEGIINLGRIKSRGDIYQGHHSNKGNIYQGHHSNKGGVLQGFHSNKGNVLQSYHSNKGDVYQSYHSNKGRVIDFGGGLKTDTLIIGTLIAVFLGLLVTLIKIQL
jgi:hypothetical protein